MSGGGSQTSNSSGASAAQIPAWQQPLLKSSASSWQGALNAANANGGLAGLLQSNPEQIAQLTPNELANIGQLQNIAQNGSPLETSALTQLNQLTGGQIGSSPATIAAMNAYEQNIAPTINSTLAATGGGRGGEQIAAQLQGQTDAYVPLVQQEIANRQAAVPLYSQLASQQSSDIQNAMSASDMQRQIQQSQLSANFQDYLRRSGLIQQYTLGPEELLGGSTIGTSSTGTQTTSSPGGKF